MSQVISHRKATILRGIKGLCAALMTFSAVTNTWAATDAVMNSPAGGQLPVGITRVGGIVIDLVGFNGTRVVGEIAAGQLYQGWPVTSPTVIGIQTGFTPTIISALGGGLSKAAFRVTLWDGDSAPGDFDYQKDSLWVNGFSAGDFSLVPTTETDPAGNTVLSTNLGGGFRDGIFDTGFFSVNGINLTSLFTSLQTTGSLTFTFVDLTPNDNALDFKQGLAGNLAYVGHLPGIGGPTQVLENAGPTYTPPYIDYVAEGNTITRGSYTSIGSVDFTPGSTLTISGTLGIASNRIHSQAGGVSSIDGGYLNNPATLTFDLAGDQRVGSDIIGFGGIIKTGSATLTLTGTNEYTGATTVDQGTLQIGNGLTGSILASSPVIISGSGVLAINLANNGEFASSIDNGNIVRMVNVNTNIVSGIISGSGSVIQDGTGLTNLTGSNSYTGATVINSGTLQIGATGSISSESVIGIHQGGALLLSTALPELLSRSYVNDGKVILDIPTDACVLSGTISGSGSLVQAGTNTVIIGVKQSYTGSTVVEAGVMKLAADNLLASTTRLQVNAGGIFDLEEHTQTVGSLVGNGTVSVGFDSMFSVGFDNTNATFAGSINGLGGVIKVGSGTWTLTGNNTCSVPIIADQGTVQIGDGVTGSLLLSDYIIVSGSGVLAINMANDAAINTLVFNMGLVKMVGANTNIVSSEIFGPGGFVQDGPGLTKLTGSNNYDGATIVNAGTLSISGSMGAISSSSALIVRQGGTLLMDTAVTDMLSKSITSDGMVVLQESAFDTYVLSGTISGSGAVIKTGTNTLVIGANQTYTGSTVVAGGVLKLAADNLLASSARLQVNTGATFDLETHSQTVGSLLGGGTISTGSSAVLSVGADNSNTTFSGAINGSGAVNKVGSGNWIVTGANTYTGPTNILGGGLLINGSLKGDVLVKAGILGGSGIIHGNVVNQAIVSPGNSPGTLTIGGNYTQSASGVLSIQIASATVYDKLVVGGKANLNGTLLVSSLGDYRPVPGTSLTILTADQGITGTFSDVTSAGLAKVTVVYQASSVLLESAYKWFGDAPGLSLNERAVALALDKMMKTSNFYDNKRLTDLCDYLTAFSRKDLPSAFERIVPTDYVILPDASFGMAQVQASNLERRTEEIRSSLVEFTANVSAPSSYYTSSATVRDDGVRYIDANGHELAPTPIERRIGFFLNGSGEFVDDKSSTLSGGGKFNTGGISTGADYRFNDNFAAGLTAGYANTTTTGRGDGSVGIDTGDISVYATGFNEGYFVNGILGGGSSNYGIRRDSLDGSAHADTSGMNFHALLGGGYSYTNAGFSAGPIVSLRYTSVQIDGFSEKGSLAPLDIFDQSKSSFKSLAGFQVAYAIPAGSVIVKPQAKLQWQHEFSNDNRDIDAAFQSGGPFTVSGPSLGSDSLVVDLGASVQITPTTAVYGYYSGDIGATNYTSNSVFGGVQLSF